MQVHVKAYGSAKALTSLVARRRLATAPRIAVHGGAWAIPDHLVGASLRGVHEACEVGGDVLRTTESALSAVEAAVRVLEADPAFDAGHGAVLNAAGEVELDAILMDGRDLRVGAVAAMGPVMHPVSVARLVMEQTEHALLVGEGANAFAREQGIPLLDAHELVTDAARAEYEEMAAYRTSVRSLFNNNPSAAAGTTTLGHDTVGAVAIDAHGHVAAATCP